MGFSTGVGPGGDPPWIVRLTAGRRTRYDRRIAATFVPGAILFVVAIVLALPGQDDLGWLFLWFPAGVLLCLSGLLWLSPRWRPSRLRRRLAIVVVESIGLFAIAFAVGPPLYLRLGALPAFAWLGLWSGRIAVAGAGQILRGFSSTVPANRRHVGLVLTGSWMLALASAYGALWTLGAVPPGG